MGLVRDWCGGQFYGESGARVGIVWGQYGDSAGIVQESVRGWHGANMGLVWGQCGVGMTHDVQVARPARYYPLNHHARPRAVSPPPLYRSGRVSFGWGFMALVWGLHGARKGLVRGPYWITGSHWAMALRCKKKARLARLRCFDKHARPSGRASLGKVWG